ncbi:hypothetical protein, partial [Saccharospirillum sp. MSK14-1]|uniref:hypothetical protein n=1 Tax=Saccharospirillum sp. MSK14-1 TaxID=1897632 RepID=UPI0011B28D2F
MNWKRTNFIRLLATVLIFAMTTNLNANDETENNVLTPNDKAAELLAEAHSAGKSSAAIDDPARPQALPSNQVSSETKQSYEKALRDYYHYRSVGLEHRQSVFQWQLFSAK